MADKLKILAEAYREARDSGDEEAADRYAAAMVKMREQGGGQQQADDGFSFGEMASNIPGSAWQLAKDTVYPLMNPKDTAQGLYNIAAGLVEKAIPGGEDKHAQYVDMVAEHLKQRYGGTDEILNTLEQDPVGMMADVAGLLTGGGTIATKMGVKGANAVTKVGQLTDPLSIAATAPKLAAKGLSHLSSPVDDILSAGKFSTVLDKKFGKGTRRRIAETLLREQIPFNEGGINKLDDILNSLDDQIDAILSTQRGQLSVYDAAPNVTRHIPGLRAEYGSMQNPAPMRNLAAIDKTLDDWMTPLQRQGNYPWSLQNFHDFKRNIYRDINWSQAPDGSSAVPNETLKALARGAKDTVAENLPEIDAINRRMGDLLEAKEPLAQSSARIGNRNTFGINTPIQAGGGATVGGMIAGEPGAMVGGGVGAIRALNDIPKFKTWKAQKIYNMQNRSMMDTLDSIYGGRTLPQLIPFLMQNAAQSEQIQDPDERGLWSFPQ